MTHSIVVLITLSALNGEPLSANDKHLDQYALMEDVKKKKKKGKKIGGSKGKKSKKGFFSKIFGSK
tara:strand:- start:159 stop:356 length:198 start_codon:yes stop_codon:yes gene_type:complete